MNDINDNEIRIVGYNQGNGTSKGKSDKWKSLLGYVLAALCILSLLLVLYFYQTKEDLEPQNIEDSVFNDLLEADIESVFEEGSIPLADSVVIDDILLNNNKGASYCETTEEIVNDIPMRMLMPVGAIPEFTVGNVNEKDASIVLALQAADIRKDNGEIVGCSVSKGNVLSKGIAKKGFAAIIDGNLFVGVAEQTPMFEETVQKGGDFFRQYPLVSNGRLIDNKPKGKSIRRALCECDGNYFVVETKTKESFHDFAQALVDMKISNAIYLVSGDYGCGFLRNADGNIESWGEPKYLNNKNLNYLIWRK